MNDRTIGLDLAKHVFHLIELASDGQVAHRKRLRRSELLRFFAQLPVSLVAMEACASSHYWGRELRSLGHDVVLLPAQHVRAYQRGQKNDYNDAQAIAEAARHGSLRAVPIKTIEQQDMQSLHRLRARHIRQRTAQANQLRGLLGERGVVVPAGLGPLRRALPELYDADDIRLSPALQRWLRCEYQQLRALDGLIEWYDAQLQRLAREDEVCEALQALPGFGPVVASVVRSWLGDGRQFLRGRDASAALGIVPRQHSSGDKPRLLGISKRGDSYVRSQLIHGARAVVRLAQRKDDALSLWIRSVEARRGRNKATVALANKLMRIAWVIVTRGERYRPAAA